MTTDDRPPLLQGGRRRRRSPLRLLPLALLLGLLLWVGLAALDSGAARERRPVRRGARRAAGAATRTHRGCSTRPAPRPPAASRQRASRFRVDLSGPDSVQLRFVRKPRAGLLFDVRTGRVLWRRTPSAGCRSRA